MSEKELLLIIRDLVGFALHGPGMFRECMLRDLERIEKALHELAEDTDGAH